LPAIGQAGAYYYEEVQSTQDCVNLAKRNIFGILYIQTSL